MSKLAPAPIRQSPISPSEMAVWLTAFYGSKAAALARHEEFPFTFYGKSCMSDARFTVRRAEIKSALQQLAGGK